MEVEDFRKISPKLSDPAVSLPAYGYVQHQKNGAPMKFDPYAITDKLQATILSYVSKPPQIGSQVAFLVLLGYRQGGKSTVAEIAMYPPTAYTPAHDHVCLADTNDRAEYLHKRVHYTHQRWPEAIRVPTVSSRESRQLTFDQKIGGKMRILSMQQSAVGIGESPDSFHWSEVGFCDYADDQWTMMLPATVNRDHCRGMLECTPTPADAGGTPFWKDITSDAKYGRGRWIYAFFPFWDGKLNRRPWVAGTSIEQDEYRLLNKYGKLGLTLENLAFRRFMCETDPRIRRNPDLFGVFYPFDDVSCWHATQKGVIASAILQKFVDQESVPWRGPYMEYEAPIPDAQYAIGVDPSGFGVRDHASFQVGKVYDDELTQVACFSNNIADPIAVARKLIEVGTRYNNALIVVEANGVGAAILALLIQAGYTRVYYSDANKPGWPAGEQRNDTSLSYLVDSLLDVMVLHDEDTISQLGSYKNDKKIETSAATELLREGKISRGRRERHHWDKVSALIMMCVGARDLPRRHRPTSRIIKVAQQFTALPYEAQQEYFKRVEQQVKHVRRYRRRK
jgi:hypothetical protein